MYLLLFHLNCCINPTLWCHIAQSRFSFFSHNFRVTCRDDNVYVCSCECRGVKPMRGPLNRHNRTKCVVCYHWQHFCNVQKASLTSLILGNSRIESWTIKPPRLFAFLCWLVGGQKQSWGQLTFLLNPCTLKQLLKISTMIFQCRSVGIYVNILVHRISKLLKHVK